MSFPKDFYWGGATAANQCEGGYNEGGRGRIIQDFTTGNSMDSSRFITYRMPDGSTGKASNFIGLPKGATACALEGEYYPSQTAVDFYHHYKEDIALLAELGLKMFRMSIAWARILPEGEGRVNPEGIQFYKNVFAECHRYNIEPLVTIYHFDTPSALAE